MKLFNKVGRKNELTDSGETIYGLCRKMFEFAEEMNEIVTKRMPSTKSRIHIGVSDEVNRSFVDEVISSFLKQFGSKPKPQITLISGNLEQLSDKLRFKELDLLVSDLAMIDTELNKIAYAEIPVVLTCSSKVDMSKINSTENPEEIDNLIQEITKNKTTQWVMPSSKLKIKSDIDNYFENSGVKAQVALETDSPSSLVRGVKDEIGYSFLPLLYIANELRENSIQVVGPRTGHWKYRVWLVSQQQNRNDELVKGIAKSFNEICRA
jgi:LysR family transcriptional activator of nhaA